MSPRDFLTVTNLVFLIGGIYFIVLAGLSQAAIYSIVPGILCLVSLALLYREDLFFSTPFTLATAVFVIIVLLAQEYAAFSSYYFGAVAVASIVVNGVFFFLFLGCALAVTRKLVHVKSEEEEEAEEEQKSRSTPKPVRQAQSS
jgi:hypothetical protein